ncbi:MAG TPA: hypothetical protein VGI19_06545 [Candidatus Cybelea sp.]|jgi:hypothetical protein
MATALLTACAGTQVQPVTRGPLLDMTMPYSVHRLAHPHRGNSWMSPAAKRSPALLYVSSWQTNDVNVYDLSSGHEVGQLTGFQAPYGQCVDRNGDVYITDYTDGQVFEYAHGGTTLLNTYDSGGFPIGCAVDAKGDLAVTNYVTPSGAGDVCVWKHGSGSAACYSDSGSCYFLWPAGYDDKGNLIAVGRYRHYSLAVCALLSGSSTMTTLSYNGTLKFPGSVTWDGKHFVLPDDVYEYQYTILAQATLSGSTLTAVGATTIGCNTENESVDVSAPFVVGKKNTPVNHRQGKIVVGAGEVFCESQGPLIGLWQYPAGGNPYKIFDLGYAYGLSVSLAN